MKYTTPKGETIAAPRFILTRCLSCAAFHYDVLCNVPYVWSFSLTVIAPAPLNQLTKEQAERLRNYCRTRKQEVINILLDESEGTFVRRTEFIRQALS